MVLVLQKRQGKRDSAAHRAIRMFITGMPTYGSRNKILAQYFLGWDVVDVVDICFP